MSTTSHVFLVTPEEHATRLDLFLTTHLDGAYSRSQISEWIKQGAVLVNEKVTTKAGFSLSSDQHITVTIPQPPILALTPQAAEFEVIAEEEDFLIINKPAGLVVHHSLSAPHDVTLVHGLLERYPEFLNFEGTERPGIVHRLDKDTSGLLLVARNPQALTALAALFKERQIHKLYHAIVVGVPPRTASLTLPIGRHPFQRHKMGVNGVAARSATTHFSVLEYFENNAALIELHIVTGRTHQIRVHCAHEKFPVLGDATYGEASKLIKRQALHAHALSFTYKGKKYAYTAPYPEDFKTALASLIPLSQRTYHE